MSTEQRKTILINRDTAILKQFVALGGKCLRDGNYYGAVIGDLPEGCAAFEKTRHKAVITCMHNWRNEEAKLPKKNRSIDSLLWKEAHETMTYTGPKPSAPIYTVKKLNAVPGTVLEKNDIVQLRSDFWIIHDYKTNPGILLWRTMTDQEMLDHD